MNAKEWLKGYEHRDTTTNGEDLAADIIRALLAENDQLKADRALENDLGLPAGVLTLKSDYEQLRVENSELKQMVGKCTLSICQHHKDERLKLEAESAELRALIVELKEGTDMFETAETGEEYDTAYAKCHKAQNALFTKVRGGGE